MWQRGSVLLIDVRVESHFRQAHRGPAGTRERSVSRARAWNERLTGFAAVLNARFKGGYITRAYGSPKKGVNAIQLEMAQAIYMDEGPPFAYRPDRAAKVTAAIRTIIAAALEAL